MAVISCTVRSQTFVNEHDKLCSHYHYEITFVFCIFVIIRAYLFLFFSAILFLSSICFSFYLFYFFSLFIFLPFFNFFLFSFFFFVKFQATIGSSTSPGFPVCFTGILSPLRIFFFESRRHIKVGCSWTPLELSPFFWPL